MTQWGDRADNDALLQRIGLDLIEVGFSVIPYIQSMAHGERTNTDNDQWLQDHAQQAEETG